MEKVSKYKTWFPNPLKNDTNYIKNFHSNRINYSHFMLSSSRKFHIFEYYNKEKYFDLMN